MEKKVLTLSVKKEWFDKILSGEKKDALLSGKYSAESEVFVPGVSIDKL